MNDVERNRVRLWLHSEKALGLSYVPAAGLLAAEGAAAPQAAPAFPGSPADEPPTRVPSSGTAGRPPTRSRSPADEPPTRVPTPAGRPAPAGSAPAAPPPPAAVAPLFGRDEPPAPAVPSPALPAFDAPPLSPDEKRVRLTAMDADEVRGCIRCRLCETRTKTVFGEGNADARLFFIGEGPGRNEDASGRPFVGRAGDLLNKMIAGMGLRREDVFIANVIKCRAFLPGPPPKDRAPAADEVAACTPYLQRQLEIVRPNVIVTLGLPASRYMLNSTQSMGRLRGQWHDWRGIKLMPTYHPAYMLREYEKGEAAKRAVREAVWSDLKQVMAVLGLPAKAC